VVEGGKKWRHIDLSMDGFRVILHKWCTSVCTTIERCSLIFIEIFTWFTAGRVSNIYLLSVRHWRRRQDSNLIFQLHNFPAFEFFFIFVKLLFLGREIETLSQQYTWLNIREIETLSHQYTWLNIREIETLSHQYTWLNIREIETLSHVSISRIFSHVYWCDCFLTWNIYYL
jgi:hypothetical protein